MLTPDERASSTRLLLVAAFAIAGVMLAFEATKQFMLPRLSLWESHVITILFTTVLATVAASLVGRKFAPLSRGTTEQEQSAERARLSHQVQLALESTGEEVHENGLLLGHFPEETYSVVHVPVEPGDRAVPYTDGILEARNPSEEMFGPDRLKRSLESNHYLEADPLVDSLLDELSLWSEHPKGQGQQDDITLLVVDFKAH
jgi:hypothetical protein